MINRKLTVKSIPRKLCLKIEKKDKTEKKRFKI